MTTQTVITSLALPGKTGVILMARIVGVNNTPIVQATISTITYAVQNVTQGTSAGTGSFTVSSVIYDNLQTADDSWNATMDTPANPSPVDGLAGYNFRATIPASILTPTEDLDEYRADVKFVPASGEQFFQPFLFPLLLVYG